MYLKSWLKDRIRVIEEELAQLRRHLAFAEEEEAREEIRRKEKKSEV